MIHYDNVLSLNKTLKRCKNEKRYKDGIKVWETAKAEGVEPTVLTLSHLVPMLLGENMFKEAQKLVKSYGVETDLSIIVGFLKYFVNNKDVDGLLEYLKSIVNHDEFQEIRKEPNIWPSLVATVLRYGDQSQYSELCELEQSMGFERSDETYGAIVKTFSEMGFLDEATNVIHQLLHLNRSLNTIVFEGIIIEYRNRNDWEGMWKIIRLMFSCQLTLSKSTIRLLIPLYLEHKPAELPTLINTLETIETNSVLFELTRWVTDLYNEGKRGEAWKMFEIMCKYTNVDLTAFNTFMALLLQRGELLEAKKLYNQIFSYRLIPNDVIITTYVNGMIKEGALDEASRVISQDLPKFKIRVTLNFYTGLIAAYSKHPECHHLCYKIIDTVFQSKLELDRMFYLTLINFYCRAENLDKAEDIIQTMEKKNMTVDNVVYLDLMRGLIKANKLEKAAVIHWQLCQSQSAVHIDGFKILIKAYMKEKNFDKAMELVKQLREKLVQPDLELKQLIFKLEKHFGVNDNLI